MRVPDAGLVGVLLVRSRKFVKEFLIASLSTLVAGTQCILDVLETTQDIARHIQRHHGQEDDIHQVNHLLARTQTTVICTHSVYFILVVIACNIRAYTSLSCCKLRANWSLS